MCVCIHDKVSYFIYVFKKRSTVPIVYNCIESFAKYNDIGLNAIFSDVIFKSG